MSIKWDRHIDEDGSTAEYRSRCGRFLLEPYFGNEREWGSPSQRQGWALYTLNADGTQSCYAALMIDRLSPCIREANRLAIIAKAVSA